MLCACGSDSKTAAPPCVDGDSKCGTACSEDRPCRDGLYCDATHKCGKQCVEGDADFACVDLSACMPDGRCAGSAAALDAGLDGGGRLGGGGSGNDLGGIDWDASIDAGVCADQTVAATRVTPNVMLIIDQSTSMNATFGGGTRWNVLRDFLLGDPGGLIADLQSQVRFGLAMYTYVRPRDLPPDAGPDVCPAVSMVAPAIDNFTAIADTYGMAEAPRAGNTPTGDSIDQILDDLSLDTVRPDTQDDPYVFILATDGDPDRCEDPDAHDAVSQQETIDAVTRAYGLGVRTFIISVGDEVSMTHQQDVANAGLGRMPGDPDAEFWTAGDDQGLRAALTGIVQRQLSCEVTLNGAVPGDGCDGKVRLNGRLLDCNDDNGWSLVDDKHVLLQGSACAELKDGSSARLEVSFPCGVDIVF